MTQQTDFLKTITGAQTSPLPAKAEILKQVRRLVLMHKRGMLGGELMPEDANPGLPSSSAENYLFFTLPMALNYQRNSYALWPAATKTFNDPETCFVFNPEQVCNSPVEKTRAALLKHKVALQPIKHTDTWIRLCRSLATDYKGDVRVLISEESFSVARIKEVLQKTKKAGFPYLSGNKICNYWLYVLEQYTDARFQDRHCITVAPDTHVTQASFRLGLLSSSIIDEPNFQELIADAWESLLDGTEFSPIDVHTPLWLWSRKGFPTISDGIVP